MRAAGKMRVCMLSCSRPALSDPLYTKEAASLAAAGLGVTIVAPCTQERDPLDASACLSDVRIIPLYIGNTGETARWRKLAALPRLLAIAVSRECDVYHAIDPASLLVGAIAKVLRGRRLVYDAREHYPGAISSNLGLGGRATWLVFALLWLGESLLSLLADHVFTVDQVGVRRFRQLRRSVSLLTNLPHRAFAPNDPALEPDHDGVRAPMEVLMLGISERLTPVVPILQALRAVRTHGLDVHATLIGDSDEERRAAHLRLANQLGVADAVRVIGWVPNASVGTFLSQADCALLLYRPTRVTVAMTNPVKLMEYMAFGLPIVCSDYPGLRSTVERLCCGVLVDALDAESIARALTRLARDPALRSGLGRNGRAAFQTNWNWEAQEPSFLAAYRAIRRAPTCRTGASTPGT